MSVSERAAAQNTVLVFPHIPKTGGTTLLYHFRKFFGDSKVLILGPHGRVRSFFEDRPQFEEMTAADLADIRVIQGHGVGEDTLHPLLQAGKLPKLITVLRNPLALTRSRFNHKANAIEQRGGGVLRPEVFLKQDQGNAMCEILTTKFPSFIEPDCGGLARAGLSVLQKFHYVFVTEQMDQQVKGPMQYLGLPCTLERRRVAQSKRDLPISDAELAKQHREDLVLFEQANHLLEGDGASYNPTGFQPDSAQKTFDLLARAPGDSPGYRQLTQGLCGELLLEAALVKLELQGEVSPVAAPAVLEEILLEEWEQLQGQLRPAQRDLSRNKATAMRQRLTRAAHKKQRLLRDEVCR